LIPEHYQKNLAEMIDKLEEEQSALLAEDADDDADNGTVVCEKLRTTRRQVRCVRSFSSYNRRRQYDGMESSCCATIDHQQN